MMTATTATISRSQYSTFAFFVLYFLLGFAFLLFDVATNACSVCDYWLIALIILGRERVCGVCFYGTKHSSTGS
jgi:hypothetical protein